MKNLSLNVGYNHNTIELEDNKYEDWCVILMGNVFNYTTNYSVYTPKIPDGVHTLSLDTMIDILNEHNMKLEDYIILNGVEITVDDLLDISIFASDIENVFREGVVVYDIKDPSGYIDPRSHDYDGEHAWEKQQDMFNDFDDEIPF